MNKNEMRRQISSRLDALTEDSTRKMSRDACMHLVDSDAYKTASVILFYLAMPKEIDLEFAMLHAWQRDKVVAVPKVLWQEKRMVPVEINSMEADYAVQVSGLRNPRGGSPVPLQDIELVVTPALAYDLKGNRLGRGGGYYDRFLASEGLDSRVCGIGFDQQVVESVPSDGYDMKVEYLVTEKGVKLCTAVQGG